MGVLIVTGGSRGIGAATARLAARRGWAVAVGHGGRADAADAVCVAVRAEGGRARPFRADVAEAGEVAALFDAVARDMGTPTGLVTSAGIAGPAAPLADHDPARWRRLLAVNVEGTMLCAREAMRRMAPGGGIVTLSSMAATLGGANEFVDYAASKGAVESLTIGLAREAAPRGIRVNAVRPGLIDTDMQADVDPTRVARLEASVPLGRAGTAEEVAAAIVWLLSPEASYVTGAVLPVAGGR